MEFTLDGTAKDAPLTVNHPAKVECRIMPECVSLEMTVPAPLGEGVIDTCGPPKLRVDAALCAVYIPPWMS